jgi:hypothetical protein
MQNTYQIINIQQRPSKLHKGFFWLITFQDIQSGELLETYADPNMKNFGNWEEIIEHADSGIIVSGLKTVQRAGKTIVSADSKVTVEVVCNRLDMDRMLAQWRDDNSPYNKLFS